MSTGYVEVSVIDYLSGRNLGVAKIRPYAMDCYTKQTLGQWPEGIVEAWKVMDQDEIDRLGIYADTTVYLED